MTSCTSGILPHIPQGSITFHNVSECSTTSQHVPQHSQTSLECVAQSFALIYFLVATFIIKCLKASLSPNCDLQSPPGAGRAPV